MSSNDTSTPTADRRQRSPVSLSVVMPCYNEADQVEECLRGWAEALSETVESYEIIVINDGSMDGTGRVLDKVRKEMPALRVIHQLNSGQDAAIRRGYEAARGAFVLQTEANGRFDPSDFEAFWEKRSGHCLLIARRTRPLEGWLARAQGRIIQSLVKFLFNAEWQEPQTPFRLTSRHNLERQLKRLPRGTTLVNLALTLLTHMDDPRSVTELPIPFRFPNGLRRRTSILALFSGLLHTAMELAQLRLSLLKLGNPNTSPAEAL